MLSLGPLVNGNVLEFVWEAPRYGAALALISNNGAVVRTHMRGSTPELCAARAVGAGRHSAQGIETDRRAAPADAGEADCDGHPAWERLNDEVFDVDVAETGTERPDYAQDIQLDAEDPRPSAGPVAIFTDKMMMTALPLGIR